MSVLAALHGDQTEAPPTGKDHMLSVGPAHCTTVGKVVTSIFHCAITAGILLIQYNALQPVGAPALHVSGVHIAVLLGLWGPQAGSHRHVWVPNPVHEKFGVTLFLVLGLVEYMGIGMIEFNVLEGDAASGGVFANSGWVDLLWYAFLLLTTVGYGNTFTPSSPYSRLFTIKWSLFGLFLFGAATSTVTDLVGRIRQDVVETFERMNPPRISTVAPTPATASPQRATPGFKPPALYEVGKRLLYNLLAFLLLNYVGSFIFYRVEDFSFFDAFYHCIMTATTIGLGDIAPQTQAGRLYGVFHMVAATSLIGTIIGTILGALRRRAQDAKKAEMLRKTLDEELIATLDRDGDGVDKTEFVLGMLEILGVCEKEDYEPFIRQFQELDRTGDGRLHKGDLMKIAQNNREKRLEEQKSNQKPNFYEEKMTSHARHLCVPTFVLCFGFMWCQIYGYLMLPAGILNCLAIGSIIGNPPGARPYMKIATLVAIGSCLVIGAVITMWIMVTSTRTYVEIDSSSLLIIFGSLNVRTHCTHVLVLAALPELLPSC